jgi:hypothetical protein
LKAKANSAEIAQLILETLINQVAPKAMKKSAIACLLTVFFSSGSLADADYATLILGEWICVDQQGAVTMVTRGEFHPNGKFSAKITFEGAPNSIHVKGKANYRSTYRVQGDEFFDHPETVKIKSFQINGHDARHEPAARRFRKVLLEDSATSAKIRRKADGYMDLITEGRVIACRRPNQPWLGS